MCFIYSVVGESVASGSVVGGLVENLSVGWGFEVVGLVLICSLGRWSMGRWKTCQWVGVWWSLDRF